MPQDIGTRPLVAQAFRARGLGVPQLTVRSSPHLYYALVYTGYFLVIGVGLNLLLSGKRLGLTDFLVQPRPIGVFRRVKW